MQNDRRKQKTLQALSYAFLAISETKDYRKINVKELCERANINRGTFYDHFLDMEDYLERFEMELADGIIGIFSQYQYDTDGRHLSVFINYILENSSKLFILFDHRSSGKGLEKVFTVIKEKTIPVWQKESSLSKDQAELIFAYMMKGTFSLIQEWYQTGYSTDKEWLKECLENIVKYGVYSYIYTR